SRKPPRAATIAASILLAAAAAVFLTRAAIGHLLVLGPQDHLLLTPIENQTGDKILDGTISQGLELALQQSASLNVLGVAAYQAGLHQLHSETTPQPPNPQTPQQIAQKLNARAFLRGHITGSAPPYTIRIEILRADSTKRIAYFEERASTRNDLPSAIDRLAFSLRRAISHDTKADIASSVPLEHAQTASIDALHAYAQGETALENGLTASALQAFQSAVAFDPAFVQAQIRLAWLYRDEKAELASSHAAELAKSSSIHSSSKLKTLADFCYEANTSGDYPKAASTIRKYIAQYPHDDTGMEGLARILSAQGFFPESLLAAQQGIAEDPYDPDIYNQAEAALLALSRYSSVLQMQAQAGRNGVLADTSVLPAAYLAGNQEILLRQLHPFTALPKASKTADGTTGPEDTTLTYAALDNYGRYLDSTGNMTAALDFWKQSAAKAQSAPELASTAASMLAQAALDRAIGESCTVALALVDQLRPMPKGPTASYKTALAAAMCGNQTYAEKSITELEHAYPHDTLVEDVYLPTLHAASDLGVYEPAKTLQQLLATERDDRSILSPYLRGLARFNLRQTDPALSDFQTVQARRGAAWMVAGTLYPMAEIYLARAHALARNKPDSAEAYRKFLATWPDADRTQPLIREALARSK
ncbi:MAG: hypothetical protein M3Y50_17285, partial [Acidobacteriota bacterium]|nr:hypothetical protein [Acidobacteriota bacterium]